MNRYIGAKRYQVRSTEQNSLGRQKYVYLLVGAAAASLISMVGCGSEDALKSVAPTLDISSPGDNSTVNLSNGTDGSRTFPVEFSTNWALKAQGQCNGQENCGHIDVFVDSTSCNAPGLAKNTTAVVSPALPDLSKCTIPTGRHTILLELHNEAGELVTNSAGGAASSSITVTAQ